MVTYFGSLMKLLMSVSSLSNILLLYYISVARLLTLVHWWSCYFCCYGYLLWFIDEDVISVAMVTYFGSLMKLLMSVSSFNNILLSFCVLFNVLWMNSSKSMPVESLYGPLSKLESTKLWKKSLQQFHQYQQNKQSPLILTHSTRKKKDHDIWCWKSKTWLGTSAKMWRG
jgi:hypothetical protein